MKNAEHKDTYDVIIIGGGPAGMIAAGRAAEKGARVLLIEKNKTLGKKLLITGGGRSNITNAEFDTRTFLSKFKNADKFLFSAFSQIGPAESIAFFNTHGMDTKTEAEKRVFPTSDSAQSVWNVLVEYMKKGGVEILSNSAVKNIHTTEETKKTKMITSVELTNGRHISARSYILATGGKSHPETGSTGDGFDWLKKLGHTVIESNSALVPVAMKDEWVKNLQGLALSDVRITAGKTRITGKILFTHFGLSGPAILNLSKDIHDLLSYRSQADQDTLVSLDLFPTKNPGEINTALQELFKNESNKKCKNVLSLLPLSPTIPARLQETLVTLAEIDPDKPCHSVTREERIRLGHILKQIIMHVSHLLSTDKAIITSGGLSLEEVDFKTMQSRLYENLYCIGDLLNIDRPSGGYSLQLCWTTGYVAGGDVGDRINK